MNRQISFAGGESFIGEMADFVSFGSARPAIGSGELKMDHPFYTQTGDIAALIREFANSQTITFYIHGANTKIPHPGVEVRLQTCQEARP